MTPEDIKELLDLAVDPDISKEVVEEKVFGQELFAGMKKHLPPQVTISWLFNKEWEDVMVPLRLPKGMSELLTTSDKTKGEGIIQDLCAGCGRKSDCQLVRRNPSEILMTSLMKVAFAEMIVREGLPK